MQWEYNWNQGYTSSDQFVGGFAPPSPAQIPQNPRLGAAPAPYNQVAFPIPSHNLDTGYMVPQYQNDSYESDRHRHHHNHHHNDHHSDSDEGRHSRPRSKSHSNHHHHHHRSHHNKLTKSRHRGEEAPQIFVNDTLVSGNRYQEPQPPQYTQPQPRPHLQSYPQSQPQFRSQPSPQPQLQPQPRQPMMQYQPQPVPQGQPAYGPQSQPQDLQRGLGQHLRGLIGYSKCTGNKRAICIGINYNGQKNELKGCVNDAMNVRRFLISNWGFKSENVRILTDDSPDPRAHPTRANILGAMKWLIRDAKAHDSLFFHYSGHGGQVADTDGDETDGYDEVIFPLDYRQNGIISDDEMNTIMVRPIPDGCRLTALFDSCHSGSVLDLVYEYHSDGRIKKSGVAPAFQARKSSAGDVISFSGCDDSQTSADTNKNGLAVGAMSYTFVKCLKDNPKQTYIQLLRSVREVLNQNYSQKPQLSSSHPLEITRRFIL